MGGGPAVGPRREGAGADAAGLRARSIDRELAADNRRHSEGSDGGLRPDHDVEPSWGGREGEVSDLWDDVDAGGVCQPSRVNDSQRDGEVSGVFVVWGGEASRFDPWEALEGVRVAISQGNAVLQEHLPGMGRRSHRSVLGISALAGEGDLLAHRPGERTAGSRDAGGGCLVGGNGDYQSVRVECSQGIHYLQVDRVGPGGWVRLLWG